MSPETESSETESLSKPIKAECLLTESSKAEPISEQPVEAEAQPEEPQESFISKLAAGELFQIAARLSPASQMCLALTCKSFFNIIGTSKTLRKSLQYRVVSRPPNSFQRHRTPFRTPRWELLRLLENNDWRACSDCICLHLISGFDPNTIGTAGQRCGMGPETGYLNLCPCRRFTHDLWKVANKLSQPGIFQCLHSCSCRYNSVDVETRITATLRDEGTVIIETEYLIPEAHLPHCLQHVPRFCCIHRSVYQHLIDLWEMAQSPRMSPLSEEYKQYMSCTRCNTIITDVDWEADLEPGVKTTCSFKTRRLIRKDTEGPDKRKRWANHSTTDVC